MTDETKTTSNTKPIPLPDIRVKKAQRFNLKKIIIGFVFAASFVSASYGSLFCVPFGLLALWMASAKTE